MRSAVWGLIDRGARFIRFLIRSFACTRRNHKKTARVPLYPARRSQVRPVLERAPLKQADTLIPEAAPDTRPGTMGGKVEVVE